MKAKLFPYQERAIQDLTKPQSCRFLQPKQCGGRTVLVCKWMNPAAMPRWMAVEHCFHQIWHPEQCTPSICRVYEETQ